jgi:predicted deacylase
MRPLDRAAKTSCSAEAFESIAAALTLAGAAGWIAQSRSLGERIFAGQKVRAATSRG